MASARLASSSPASRSRRASSSPTIRRAKAAGSSPRSTTRPPGSTVTPGLSPWRNSSGVPSRSNARLACSGDQPFLASAACASNAHRPISHSHPRVVWRSCSTTNSGALAIDWPSLTASSRSSSPQQSSASSETRSRMPRSMRWQRSIRRLASAAWRASQSGYSPSGWNSSRKASVRSRMRSSLSATTVNEQSPCLRALALDFPFRQLSEDRWTGVSYVGWLRCVPGRRSWRRPRARTVWIRATALLRASEIDSLRGGPG